MPKPHKPDGNRLLATLPRRSLRAILSGLEPVQLRQGDVLFQADGRIRHAWFPCNCVISLVAMTGRSRALEVGAVGPEGMAGMPLVLGRQRSPVQGLVQGSGDALRIEARSLQRALQADRLLERTLTHYAHVGMATAMRIAACNNVHRLQSRLSRWLLMMRDRLSSDVCHITHALLADLLGVQRGGVTRAAGDLQRRNLIDCGRGTITILDGKGLQAVSCNCYGVLRRIETGAAA